MSEKWFYKEVDCLIPGLVYLYALKDNERAMLALHRLFTAFLFNGVLVKNSDSYSFGEKIEEVEKYPEEGDDPLSLWGKPFKLIDLPYEEDQLNGMEIDNKTNRHIPELREIISELESHTGDDKNLKEAVRSIKNELKLANITY